MKVKNRAFLPSLSKYLLSAIFALMLLLLSSHSFATPSANIIYSETALGGGLWQYDYTFHNSSTSSEYLYNIFWDFDQSAIVNWVSIPSGWTSTLWGHTPSATTFLDAYSNSPDYDIAAGSSLGLFSFTIDYKPGDIAYIAYLDDHQGGITNINSVTSVAPEPISSLLFLIGSVPLLLRRTFMHKKR